MWYVAQFASSWIYAILSQTEVATRPQEFTGQQQNWSSVKLATKKIDLQQSLLNGPLYSTIDS